MPRTERLARKKGNKKTHRHVNVVVQSHKSKRYRSQKAASYPRPHRRTQRPQRGGATPLTAIYLQDTTLSAVNSALAKIGPAIASSGNYKLKTGETAPATRATSAQEVWIQTRTMQVDINPRYVNPQKAIKVNLSGVHSSITNHNDWSSTKLKTALYSKAGLSNVKVVTGFTQAYITDVTLAKEIYAKEITPSNPLPLATLQAKLPALQAIMRTIKDAYKDIVIKAVFYRSITFDKTVDETANGYLFTVENFPHTQAKYLDNSILNRKLTDEDLKFHLDFQDANKVTDQPAKPPPPPITTIYMTPKSAVLPANVVANKAAIQAAIQKVGTDSTNNFTKAVYSKVEVVNIEYKQLKTIETVRAYEGPGYVMTVRNFGLSRIGSIEDNKIETNLNAATVPLEIRGKLNIQNVNANVLGEAIVPTYITKIYALQKDPDNPIPQTRLDQADAKEILQKAFRAADGAYASMTITGIVSRRIEFDPGILSTKQQRNGFVLTVTNMPITQTADLKQAPIEKAIVDAKLVASPANTSGLTFLKVPVTEIGDPTPEVPINTWYAILESSKAPVSIAYLKANISLLQNAFKSVYGNANVQSIDAKKISYKTLGGLNTATTNGFVITTTGMPVTIRSNFKDSAIENALKTTPLNGKLNILKDDIVGAPSDTLDPELTDIYVMSKQSSNLLKVDEMTSQTGKDTIKSTFVAAGLNVDPNGITITSVTPARITYYLPGGLISKTVLGFKVTGTGFGITKLSDLPASTIETKFRLTPLNGRIDVFTVPCTAVTITETEYTAAVTAAAQAVTSSGPSAIMAGALSQTGNQMANAFLATGDNVTGDQPPAPPPNQPPSDDELASQAASSASDSASGPVDINNPLGLVAIRSVETTSVSNGVVRTNALTRDYFISKFPNATYKCAMAWQLSGQTGFRYYFTNLTRGEYVESDIETEIATQSWFGPDKTVKSIEWAVLTDRNIESFNKSTMCATAATSQPPTGPASNADTQAPAAPPDPEEGFSVFVLAKKGSAATRPTLTLSAFQGKGGIEPILVAIRAHYNDPSIEALRVSEYTMGRGTTDALTETDIKGIGFILKGLENVTKEAFDEASPDIEAKITGAAAGLYDLVSDNIINNVPSGNEADPYGQGAFGQGNRPVTFDEFGNQRKAGDIYLVPFDKYDGPRQAGTVTVKYDTKADLYIGTIAVSRMDGSYRIYEIVDTSEAKVKEKAIQLQQQDGTTGSQAYIEQLQKDIQDNKQRQLDAQRRQSDLIGQSRGTSDPELKQNFLNQAAQESSMAAKYDELVKTDQAALKAAQAQVAQRLDSGNPSTDPTL